MKLKPNLKCTKFAQYKEEYEKKIATSQSNFGEVVEKCEQVKEEHAQLEMEKEELMHRLSSGGDVVHDLVDKIERMEKVRNDLAKQVDATAAKLKAEEDARQAVEESGFKVKQEIELAKKEVKDLKSGIEKTEEDITTLIFKVIWNKRYILISVYCCSFVFVIVYLHIH